MRKNKPIALLLGIASIMFLTACQSDKKVEPEAEAGAMNIDKKGAYLDMSQEVLTLNGAKMELQSVLSGAEVTMFYVWNPMQEEGQEEALAIDRLSQDYIGKGIQVVGIMGEPGDMKDEKIQEAVRSSGVSYMQLWEIPELKTMYEEEFRELPFAFFADSKGNILGEPYSGMRDQEEWRGLMEGWHNTSCLGDHPAESGGG